MKMSCMLRAAVLSCACTIFSAYAAEDSAVAEAKAVADNLTRQLGGALKEALQIGGPAAAIGVCRDKAPALAGELRIGRPDLPREYDDGSLVDVNRVPGAVLAAQLGAHAAGSNECDSGP